MDGVEILSDYGRSRVETRAERLLQQNLHKAEHFGTAAIPAVIRGTREVLGGVDAMPARGTIRPFPARSTAASFDPFLPPFSWSRSQSRRRWKMSATFIPHAAEILAKVNTMTPKRAQSRSPTTLSVSIERSSCGLFGGEAGVLPLPSFWRAPSTEQRWVRRGRPHCRVITLIVIISRKGEHQPRTSSLWRWRVGFRR